MISERIRTFFTPHSKTTSNLIAMKIYIILRDTASNFDHEVVIIDVSFAKEKATETFQNEVNKARALAEEMGYHIEESDKCFESYEDGCEAENRYSVWMEEKEIEDDRSVRAKLHESLEALKSIPKSRYIPYSSPSPSSTESCLKRELNASIEHLENAVSLDESLYGKRK